MEFAETAPEEIESKIYLIRGEKVMLDLNLAPLYGVTTKRLNEQVRRNLKRFPSDFMFTLSSQELTNLRSQTATASSKHGERRYNPMAFTEHGVSMPSSILRSDQAIEANITIIRAFVKMRSVL